jgi:hypothetical protein
MGIAKSILDYILERNPWRGTLDECNGATKVKEMELRNIFLLGIFFLGSMGFVVAATLPTAPNSLTASAPSTFDQSAYGPRSVEAIAGNITALVVTAIGQTKDWQGYYGNVSGSITLDDASNFTFYNWTSAEPRGQVYATLNSSIGWSGVNCFNYTNDSAAYWQTIESFYNIPNDGVDGVNETFNQTTHPSFQVGSRTMSGCPTTYVFQSDAYQQSNFANVLLYDPALNETGWIYATIIENKTIGSSQNDLLCYNGVQCDFQILVNEDGHGTDTASTTYYFWVELV